MRRLIFAVALMLPVLLRAQAVEPLIFREKLYDFGDIAESKGNAAHEFVFSNNSGRPVKILNVSASCGCTTPGWTKDPIASGKTGFIKASFDPKGRPGYFNKTLTVLTDLDPNPMILQIKGQVVTAIAEDDGEYPVSMGRLKLKSRAFSMGTVYINKEASQKQFAIMNDGAVPLKFLSVEKPAYVRVDMPAVLEPKQKGFIKITYDGKLRNKYGFASDNVMITTSDHEEEKKSFSLFASLEDFFSPPTPEELLMAPQAYLKEQTVDLGQHKAGESLERNVTILNKGKKELKIHALQGNCPCIFADVEKNTVRAGDSTQVKIVFKPQNRGGTQQKAIAIYTNDPRNSVQWLNVIVYIQD